MAKVRANILFETINKIAEISFSETLSLEGKENLSVCCCDKTYLRQKDRTCFFQ